MSFKSLIAGAGVAAAVLASGSAGAFGVFTANPGNLGFSSQLTSFNSDYIAGNYSEVVTLTPTNITGTTGTFDYSILWRGNEFQLAGQAVDNGNGTASTTGLGLSYSLYATLKGSGSYTISGSNVSFSPDLGDALTLYAIAGGGLGTITAPTDGTGSYSFTNANTSLGLISGDVTSAEGNLKACQGTDCGSFGVVTTVDLLSPNGTDFFTAPRPFFDISFEAGNFNQYWLTQVPTTSPATFNLGGGAQITFDNAVPEPGTLALAGLALLGLGALRRRKA